jgi:NSS family neurotransmitter:Na+ symporter
VVVLHERLGLSRPKATLLTIFLLVVLGATCALSNSTLADFKLFGLTPFDLFDFVSSNIILPVGGIFIALFVGWVWGLDKFSGSLSNHGQLQNQKLTQVVFLLLRYVSPALILIVMLKGLKVF